MDVDSNVVEEFANLEKGDVEFIKKCSKLVQDIKSKESTILLLVEYLQPLLVNPAPDNRALGTWVLTSVLEDLPSNFLDEKHLIFISAFYTDRLKDHHQVIPAVLSGVIALVKCDNYPNGAAMPLLQALFKNVGCQQQQQQDRNNIYQIFELLLDRQTSELVAMGLEFVYGVISAVDGERDPKNLVFLFNWFPKYLKTVDLRHMAEEAFEILACYYPVDFKAPPQDPNTITRDKLADALTPCLTAVPKFAEFCIPLALEKLDAHLEIAKLDSLKLLQVGCITFETPPYVHHSNEIWTLIQKQLFNTKNPDIQNSCLSTLTAVIKKISTDPNLQSTLQDITDTVKGNLLPDSRLFLPSSQLLLSAAQASKESSDFITTEIAPILINTFNTTTTPAHKVKVLQALVPFFQNYNNFHETQNEDLNSVPVLCLKAVMDYNDALRKEGFEGLTQIVTLLPLDVRLPLYESLRTILTVAQARDVRLATLNCLVKLAECYPEEVKNHVVDAILLRDSESLALFLNALCVLCPLNFFTNHVTGILLGHLSKDADSAEVAIQALNDLLERDGSKVHSVLVEGGLVSKLVDWGCRNDDVGYKTLGNLAFVLQSVIGCLSSEEQKVVILEQLPKVENCHQNRSYVFLLSGILMRLRRDVKFVCNNFQYLVDFDGDFREVSLELVANLINKCDDEIILQRYLNIAESHLPVIPWATKALVMRNHVLANAWTNKLLELLKENPEIATSFGIVMNDTFESLSNKSYCNKTLLYRQKFFTIVSNTLSQNYQKENSSYLVAFGSMLVHTPKAAILLQFQKILKLVMLCLDECPAPTVLIALLKILQDFISTKETCIENHVQEFIARLLVLSGFVRSMQVRILSLQCLQALTSSFPLYKLLPHKPNVVNVLGKCVDDKKRLVRREAVDARNAWFLLDAPI